MKTTQFNEEVFYTDEEITRITKNDLSWLKSKALANKRQRARLCSHPDVMDPLHEMLIVHVKDTYVRPHKHMGKSESFHVIEGLLNVIVFTNEGKIRETIEMGDLASGKCFYYRLFKGVYHTVVPLSELVVFHEVTNGPFKREDMVFADWSPAEDDTTGQKAFLKDVMSQ